MAYSTDLNAKENPFPGKIFTDPADNTDGDWAQYGCFEHIDYTNDDITTDVFTSIITGDAKTVTELTGKENPKVLTAGPDDTVFTYFIDHGAEGMMGIGDHILLRIVFNMALQSAFNDHLYGKWLWFVETCHSGSMFDRIPDNINIFAMTSSDREHNAAMNNCPPDDIVAGKELNTCMSGLWDNSFLDYAEQHPDCTIGEIVDAVMKDVAISSDQNVSQYGDMSFRDMKLSDFIGSPKKSVCKKDTSSHTTTVPLTDVPAHLAKWKAIRADNESMKDALKNVQDIVYKNAKKEVEIMRLGRMLVGEKNVMNAMNSSVMEYSIDCVEKISMSLVKNCGHSLPFTNKAMNLIKNICIPGRSTPSINFDEVCM